MISMSFYALEKRRFRFATFALLLICTGARLCPAPHLHLRQPRLKLVRQKWDRRRSRPTAS